MSTEQIDRCYPGHRQGMYNVGPALHTLVGGEGEDQQHANACQRYRDAVASGGTDTARGERRQMVLSAL